MDLRDINFPFFGLYKRPYELKYSLSKIQLKREENSHLETVDDKSLNGNYFARLAQLNKRHLWPTSSVQTRIVYYTILL